jgi:hypothetical protein
MHLPWVTDQMTCWRFTVFKMGRLSSTLKDWWNIDGLGIEST